MPKKKSPTQLDREIAEALDNPDDWWRGGVIHPRPRPSAGSDKDEKLPVKVGNLTLEKPMTRAGAMRWGTRNMPSDLKRVGFDTFVSKSDPEMHGGTWFRINYGKR